MAGKKWEYSWIAAARDQWGRAKIKDGWTQSPLRVTSQKRHPYLPPLECHIPQLLGHIPPPWTWWCLLKLPMMWPQLKQWLWRDHQYLRETYSHADYPASVQSCFLLKMRWGYKPGECLTDQLIPPLSSGIRQLAHHTEASVEWKPHPIPSAPPRVDPVLNSRLQTVPSVTTCGTYPVAAAVPVL